ncbi:MAG: fimbrillin family protein [Rikenellaceae bacterium]
MRNRIIYMSALFVAAVSCERADEMEFYDDYESINGTQITVSIEESRATENTSADVVANGFYLYIDQDGESTTTDGEGDILVFMKKTESGWVAYTDSTAATEATNFKWVDFKGADVTALYAMSSDTAVASLTASDMVQLSCNLPADQSSAMQYADWLVASSLSDGAVTKSVETGEVTLNFTHLYSRLTIKVLEGGTTLKSVNSCSVTNAAQSATIALSTTLSEFVAAADGADGEQGVTLFANTADTTYEAIMLPQTFADEVEIAINTYDEVIVYTTLSDLDGESDGAQLEMVSGGDYVIEVPVPVNFFPALD